MGSEFMRNVFGWSVADLQFSHNRAMIKKIARIQILIDKDFAKEMNNLSAKLVRREISGAFFFDQYKKIMLKSVGKNKETVQTIFSKVEKTIKKQFKEAEKTEKEKKPPIDLSLPK